MLRSIDELFDAYERRKESERKVATEKAAKAARERDKILALFNSRVLGPLGPLMESIRARGHAAEITRGFEDERPHLTLAFIPNRLNEYDPEPQPSRVRIGWTGHDFVETVQDVAGAASRSVSERWPVSEVTEEWTRRQVYSLVEAALRNQ